MAHCGWAIREALEAPVEVQEGSTSERGSYLWSDALAHADPLVLLMLLAGLAWPLWRASVCRWSISIRHAVKQRDQAGVPEGERVVFRFTDQDVDALDWEKKEGVNSGGTAGCTTWWERRQLADGIIELSCIDDDQETRAARLEGLTDPVLRTHGEPSHGLLACLPLR